MITTVGSFGLDIQLRVAKIAPSPTAFVPPRNTTEGLIIKPDYGTGLWTSTYAPDILSEWVVFCSEGQEPQSDLPCYLLTPDPSAPLVVINGIADLNALLWDYRRDLPLSWAVLANSYASIDFERLAADGIAGVHLTSAGQSATRFARPGLYGWDVESTCWLRWAFMHVEELSVTEAAV